MMANGADTRGSSQPAKAVLPVDEIDEQKPAASDRVLKEPVLREEAESVDTGAVSRITEASFPQILSSWPYAVMWSFLLTSPMIL